MNISNLFITTVVLLTLIVLTVLLFMLEKSIISKNIGFSNDKFVQYINKKIKKKSSFSLLSFYLFNENNEYRKEIIIDKMIKDIMNAEYKNHWIRAFRISNNEIILIDKNQEKLREVAQDLKNIIEDYLANLNYANRCNCALVYLEDSNIVDSYMELHELFNNGKSKATKSLLNVDIVNVDSNMIERIKEEEKMVATIDYALNNDKVILNYQPVYSVKENRIVSCEVLVRLENEEGEILLPNQFISIAEQHDRIYLIGKKTLEVACKFFNKVNKNGKLLKDISINCSSHEIEDFRTINNIVDAIKDNELNPTNLCIEITNANDYRNEEDYFYNIKKLKELGVSISVTGYGNEKSNLNYIIGYPINLLRFDRNYVWDSLNGRYNKVIFDNVIKIANAFDIKTVGVGVENSRQYKTLINSGVDYIQGKYISPPLNDNDFIILMNLKRINKNDEH